MGLIRYNFNSKYLFIKTNVTVILPDADWEQLKNGKKYQTLYLLHGGGEDSTSYLRYTNIELWANKYHVAVVMPEVAHSSYMNMAYGLPYFSYISEELPQIMESVFPLSSSKEDRFVAGFSMGALGALHWALKKPDFFNSMAVMSGGCDFYETTLSQNFDENNPMTRIFYLVFGGLDKIPGSDADVYKLAQDMKSNFSKKDWVRLYSVCGKEDFMYPGCCKYKRFMDEQEIPFTFVSAEGGHTWEFWNEWLPRIMEWFTLSGTLV